MSVVVADDLTEDGEGWIVDYDGALGVLVEVGVVCVGPEGADDGGVGGDVAFVFQVLKEGIVNVGGGVAGVGGVVWLELVDECFVVVVNVGCFAASGC